MERKEFGWLIKKICHYWERRIPRAEPEKGDTESEMDVWYGQVKWMAEGYGERIFEAFTKMSVCPKNIPQSIQEVYRGLTHTPAEEDDFMIGLILRYAKKYEITPLEAFYELKHPIRIKRPNLGPVLRWLKGRGFQVDLSWLKSNEQEDGNGDMEIKALADGVGHHISWQREREPGEEG
jgi:hypothetical protein